MKHLTINPANTNPILAMAKSNWPVAIVALLCWFSIVVCLDPAGSYPHLPQGPGLTIDEIFNVEQGVYLLEQARSLGWLNLVPGTSLEAYRVENMYNPDHPPLGRWWLGVHHHLTWWLAPPFEPEGHFVTACARTGSATAFALTALMIGWFATAWSGRAVGVMTAISIILMPRVYGHAHLASLETITNLTCTAAVLSVANWWSGPEVPTRRAATFTGLLLGLALMTKIQAVLIPIPVIVWALWRWRIRALVPLVIWGITAFVVFFALWPYLWLDPMAHIAQYLGRTTNRASVSVWYFGQKFADKLVPWHYPFVMFALTVPAIMHGLGLMGLLTQNAADTQPGTETSKKSSTAGNNQSKAPISATGSRGRDLLLLACTLFPLIIFSLPGVAVYDGERLFLTSFPLWAIFIGRGWIVVWRWLVRLIQSRQAAAITWCGLLLIEAIPLLSMSPFYLCYYNSVFQFRPATIDEVGLEVDYWGVGLTRQLLQKSVDVIPRESTVAIIPTLHQFQAEEFRRQSPILRRHHVKTVEYHADQFAPEFVLIYRRLADLPPYLNPRLPEIEVLESTGSAYLSRFRN